MRRIAFLSTDDLGDFFVYDELAIMPLAKRGIAVETVPWRAEVDWSRFEAVVIRSTWDYQQDVEAFLDVLSTIDGLTALHNPLDVVIWNVDKRYLLDLARAGVAIVPSRLAEGLDHAAVDGAFEAFGVDEIVAKPTVSANADDTFRVGRDDDEARRDALAALRGRSTIVQPFVPSIAETGEVSLFYFDGELSHAIRKVPAVGDFRVQEEHGGRLSSIRPGPELQAAARAAMNALPGDLLYARIDFVRGDDDAWRLMEAELIEPSLYFQLDDASKDRFADAVVDRLDRARSDL